MIRSFVIVVVILDLCIVFFMYVDLLIDINATYLYLHDDVRNLDMFTHSFIEVRCYQLEFSVDTQTWDPCVSWISLE